jgi:hypothetical protein
LGNIISFPQVGLPLHPDFWSINDLKN